VSGAGCSGAGRRPGSDHGFWGEDTRFGLSLGHFEFTRKRKLAQTGLSQASSSTVEIFLDFPLKYCANACPV